MGSRPAAVVSWSSGKDAAWALYEASRGDEVDLVGLLTTVTETYDRVAMHSTRRQLLRMQADAVGLPLNEVFLPSPCPNEVYAQRMAEAVTSLAALGVTHYVFGDLYLEDIRRYRELQLAERDLHAVFPLWKRDTGALAREMVDAGLRAHVVCVDPRQLDPSFAGRVVDHAFLDALPPEVDPCGENGEFHTFVSAGPMFAQPIPVTLGVVVEREGFVFADVLPA